MDILLVTPEYPPRSIGGGGVVYENLSRQLKGKGNSINVLAGNFYNKNLIGHIENFEFRGVTVSFIPLMRFPNFRSIDFKSYTIPTALGFFSIIKGLIQRKSSVVHLHGFCHPIVDLTALACIFMRKKYILTCHGIPKTPEMHFPLKTFYNAYLSTIERIVVRKASAVTLVSPFLKKQCIRKKLVNSNMTVVPNGPSKNLEGNPKIIKSIEKTYGLKNKRIIFAIGRISHSKGFQFLVDAMQDVVRKLPDAVAIIAGEGAYKDCLADLVGIKGLSENVKLVGWISEESKAALYERSEIVVFPSIEEPFGIVILEALTKGKPIVAFDTESTLGVLRKGSSLLVPVGDSKKLAQAIISLLTDSELYRKLVVRAKEAKTYGWKKIADQYIDVYDNFAIEHTSNGKALIPQSANH